MKKLRLILVTLMFFIACQDDDTQDDVLNANVVVLEEGLDCGNSFLIQFETSSNDIPQNDFENMFYEINLPESYKIEGLEINVDFRQPENDEFMVCTHLGISYPQIFIIRVND